MITHGRPAVSTVLALLMLLAEAGRSGSSAEPRAQFRAVVDAVTVDAFAHRDGVALTGLTSKDFVLLDNGVEQRIESIGTTGHLHLIVGLDVSGSVAGATLDVLRTAVRGLAAQLTDDDRVSLFSFSHRLRVLRRAATPREVASLVPDDLTGAGATVLHDAVVLGTSLAGADQRPAIFMLFTDGSDSGSWSSAAEALEVVRRGEVVVFAVGGGLAAGRPSQPFADYMRHPTWLPPRPADTLRFMQSVAEVSGGEFLRVEPGTTLDQTFQGILRQYRQRYLLTYTPANTAPGFHKLEVRLRNRAGTVVAREGYVAR